MGRISFIVDDSQEVEFHSALNRLGVKLDDFFIKSIERAINESSHLNATDSASPCDGDLNLVEASSAIGPATQLPAVSWRAWAACCQAPSPAASGCRCQADSHNWATIWLSGLDGT